MTEPTITEDEWRAELDKHRTPPRFTSMTDEQYRFLQSARDPDAPVPWKVVIELWQKYFNERVAISTLKTRWFYETSQRQSR